MKKMREIHRHKNIIRFFVVSAFVFLPVVLFAIFLAFRINKIAEERAFAEANRLVRVISGQQEQVFRNIRNTLISLTQFAEVEKEKSDTKSCNAYFASLLEYINRKEKMYNNLVVADATGKVLCDGSGHNTEINIADRHYFQTALQKRDFVIGEYIIGRLTGEPTLAVAYPILDENGEVKMVAIGALNLGWINNFANRMRVVKDGPILVVTDNKGKIIAQYPEGLIWAGKEFLPSSIENKIEGNFYGLWLNNFPFLFSFVHLPMDAQPGSDYLSFFIGIPAAYVANFLEKEILDYFLALATLIVISGGTGWAVSKKITQDLLTHE
jgi:hypothetical protein